MRRGRFLILIALLLVLSIGGIFVAVALSGVCILACECQRGCGSVALKGRDGYWRRVLVDLSL